MRKLIIVGTSKVEGVERSSYFENLLPNANWETNKMVTNRFVPHWTKDKKKALKFVDPKEATSMARFITSMFGDKTEVFANNWRVNLNDN